MLKEKSYINELSQLKEYLLNPGTENSKDHLVFPLFKKLFGNKFKKGTDAQGADIYIEGKLLVELKSKTDDYLKGFYQALHYSKLGLSFPAVCVITQKFIAVWKVNNIPDEAKKLSAQSDANVAPNTVGVINAKKTNKIIANKIIYKTAFTLLPIDIEGLFEKDIDQDLRSFVNLLKNLEAERTQINMHNFIDSIAYLEKYFHNPL
jgi:hypothetical protein